MVSVSYRNRKHMAATIQVDSITDLTVLWRRICWYGGAHLEGCEDNKYVIRASGDAEEVMKVVDSCIDLGNSGKISIEFE